MNEINVKKSLNLRFGAMCPDISIQLFEQDFRIPDRSEHLDKAQHSITFLYLHGLLTKAETEKAYKRLRMEVVEALKQGAA